MPARGWTRLRRPEAKLEDEDEDAEDAIDDEHLPARDVPRRVGQTDWGVPCKCGMTQRSVIPHAPQDKSTQTTHTAFLLHRNDKFHWLPRCPYLASWKLGELGEKGQPIECP